MVTRKEADQKANTLERKLAANPSDSDIEEAERVFYRIKESLDERRASEIRTLIESKKRDE